jgi:K+-sensing histidine kinase KdpD
MTRSSPLGPSASSAILHYGAAILAVAAAVVAGLLLDRFLQSVPFVSLFMCAILLVAWFGGTRQGLLATGLSILAFYYFFIRPTDASLAQDVPRLLLFTMPALFVVWVSAAQRRTAESLQRARDDLRATVQQLESLNKSLQIENAERKRAEESIRQTERELQITIDTIPALAARYRADGFVNQTWRTYTGLGLRDEIGFHPALTLSEGLHKTLIWWDSHLRSGEQ